MLKILDFKTINDLHVDPAEFYGWCNDVWQFKDECILPAKVKMWQGNSGRYITMPCVLPQLDIAGVKFIARNVDDREGIPARNSNIMIQNCSKMGLLSVCDGIWITNMRTGATAAHSFLNYKKSDTQTMGIMGLGIAADAFMHFVGHLYREPMTIKVLRYKDQAEEFIKRNSRFSQFTYEIVESYEDVCSCDVVVSAVGYARDCFADESVFKPGCLVIPIQTSGFQNCDLAFDKLIVDDFEHVKSYRYYEQFKHKAVEVSAVEKGDQPGRVSDEERILAYCGGIALHDVYAAYKIYNMACEKGVGTDVDMQLPTTRFWIEP